jgi:hypothetical protein
LDYFYDAQVKRYLTQFMRIMSNFSYKNARGEIIRVPVRYGDMNRQVGQILRKNSENTIPTAPFIACYIKDIQFDATRIQDPTFVSTKSVRERTWDSDSQQYLNTQGSNYTVQKLMPTPYLATFTADIWATNTDQKLQIWEQIAVLFNPSLELQTTDNYIDWTSISVLTLKAQTFRSRQIPQGIEQDIDIANMDFETHVWITPPAKVMQLGVITKIIASVFTNPQGTIGSDYADGDTVFSSLGEIATTSVTTPGGFDLLVLDNQAQLIIPQQSGDTLSVPTPDFPNSWYRILDMYPGSFRPGLSQLRLTKPDSTEIVAYISLNPLDETKMQMNIDADTIPTNTIIPSTVSLPSRGTIDAIVNPETFKPINPTAGIRYLILENINVNTEYGIPGYDGPDAWKNADGSDPQLYANDIIEWSGTQWNTVFNSVTATVITYITNTYTGVQYKYEPSVGQWSKSFEGIYESLTWRLIL